MKLIVNGESRELADGATVAGLLQQLDMPGGGRRGVAVAVDAEVVPRSQWERQELHDGARVEVLHAVQGG